MESHSPVTNTPAGIYLLKVNKRNTRTRCEICSKLTIKTPERHRWLNVLSNNSTNFCLASLFPFFSQCYLIIHFPSKRKFTNFLFLWKYEERFLVQNNSFLQSHWLNNRFCRKCVSKFCCMLQTTSFDFKNVAKQNYFAMGNADISSSDL